MKLPDVSWFLNMCQCVLVPAKTEVERSTSALFSSLRRNLSESNVCPVSLNVFVLGDFKSKPQPFSLLMSQREGIQTVEVCIFFLPK